MAMYEMVANDWRKACCMAKKGKVFWGSQSEYPHDVYLVNERGSIVTSNSVLERVRVMYVRRCN